MKYRICLFYLPIWPCFYAYFRAYSTLFLCHLWPSLLIIYRIPRDLFVLISCLSRIPTSTPWRRQWLEQCSSRSSIPPAAMPMPMPSLLWALSPSRRNSLSGPFALKGVSQSVSQSGLSLEHFLLLKPLTHSLHAGRGKVQI